MGLFDTIIAELECPEKNKREEEEIQIKWSPRRMLNVYHIGDVVDLDKNYSLWIKEDYVCNCCSKKTKGRFGSYIGVEDQKRHDCYIRIEKNKITSVLPERKFKKLGKKSVNPDYYKF